ncbi:MAG TPA: succinate dehydrogenase assembly factor 2 [Alphaproteobacteria bacterium]
MTLEERRKKLVFRAWHRGTREMDLLMGSFADAHVQGFDPAQLDAFEKLLSCPDPDLYDWKCGLSQPGANDDSDILRLFIEHKFAGR